MNTSIKSISLVLCSCDSYEDTWVPFCTQLVKHWPGFNMPIYLCTESKTFSYPGLDIRCPLANGKVYKQWSKRLIKLLEKIDSEFVLFMLDDFWITESVDIQSFDRILNWMNEDKRMGFVCLRYEKRDKNTIPETIRRKNCQYPLLIQCLPKEPFRITTQVGLWRKKYLLKLLRSHESAWYFETRATFRSRFYYERIYDVKRTVVNYPVGGFLGGGKCYKDYADLYPLEIIAPSVTKRGYINFGESRSYPGIKKGLSYYRSIALSLMPKW